MPRRKIYYLYKGIYKLGGYDKIKLHLPKVKLTAYKLCALRLHTAQRKAVSFYKKHKPHKIHIELDITFTKILILGIVGFALWPAQSHAIGEPIPSQIKPPVMLKSLPQPVDASQTGLNYIVPSIPDILSAIEFCESGDNPLAQNPDSTASGLFQFLDSTWGDYGGYSRAMYAPAAIQYQKALLEYEADGTAPWISSEACWG